MFPGLHARRGARPRRRGCPPRATLRARDGTVIAEGEERLVRPRPAGVRDRRAASARRRPSAPPSCAARGVPARRAGRPDRARARVRRRARRHARRRAAGRARACWRAARPQRGQSRAHDDRPGRSSAPPSTALAGRYGGIAAVRPRTGEVLALAGHRVLGAPAARLGVQDHHARGRARGRRRQAATRRSRCRRRRRSRASSSRTPTASRAAAAWSSRSRTPATRCSRRSAPSSARAGSSPTAERFGFNEDPDLAGAARSTIPDAARDRRRPRGRLDRDRPGQGAHHAAADGARGGGDRRGRRPPAPDAAQGRRSPSPCARVPASVARFVGRSMRAVVTGGTGVGAAIDGVAVAGKTGTAELRTTVNEDPVPPRSGDASRRRPRTTRPTPTPGSPPSPRPATRGSRSPCCWSARAPAARPPRPRRRQVIAGRRRRASRPRRRGRRRRSGRPAGRSRSAARAGGSAASRS